MRNLFVFVIAILSLIGCKKDIDCKDCYKDLTSDHLKKYLPISNFNNYSKAVFVNSSFQELEFEITYIENTTPTSTSIGSSHHEYTTTTLQCLYENLNNSNKSMKVETQVYYFYAPDVTSHVQFGIMPFSFVGFPFLASNYPGFDEEGIPDSGTEFTEVLKINNRSFHNVYSKITVNDQTAKMQEIYFNAEEGIVGFRDDLSGLWSFKEFKN